ncbi:MAG: hemolysin family protein [bacterium]
MLFGNELTNLALGGGASMVAELTAGEPRDGACRPRALVVPLLLVFGEITPKTIAARRAEGVARLVARPITFVKWLTTPFRRALRWLTDALVQRLGGAGEGGGRIIAEAEFRAMIDVGHRDGVVEQQERTLIHNVLDFGDLKVADVMQPYEKMLTLSDRVAVTEAIAAAIQHHHSRIPVWTGNPRKITGVVFAKDLLAIRWGVHPATPVRRLKRGVLYTPPTRPAAELLEEFRRKRMHLAIVVDEFGRAQGLVTMEDLLEELVGPISDSEEEAAEDAEEAAAEAAAAEAAAAEAAAAEAAAAEAEATAAEAAETAAEAAETAAADTAGPTDAASADAGPRSGGRDA